MFQDLLHKITTFIMVAIVSVASTLPWSINTNKSIEPHIDSPSPIVSVQVTATPSASIPSQATKPTPKIVYDGTRTGAMIDYKEFCTGKQIQIYSNEQVQYTDYFGTEHLLTNGDISCLVSSQSLDMFKKPSDGASVKQKLENLIKDGLQKCLDVSAKYYEWKLQRCGTDECKQSAAKERDHFNSECKDRMKL